VNKKVLVIILVVVLTVVFTASISIGKSQNDNKCNALKKKLNKVDKALKQATDKYDKWCKGEPAPAFCAKAKKLIKKLKKKKKKMEAKYKDLGC